MSSGKIVGTAILAVVLGGPVLWALVQMGGATNDGMWRLTKMGLGFAAIAAVAVLFGLVASLRPRSQA